jgi:glycyl-tRNA synthetase beta chain
MPQLLLELFSEEIPARMQRRAEEDLLKLVREKLAARGLAFEKVQSFSSPRRLGLVIDDLAAKAADVNEEKKGPRVGAPDQAVQGFLKSAGLKSIDEAQIVEDKKGAFYVARIERAGRPTPEIVQEAIPEVVRAFPWPKSMRSGESDLQWVRPLHNILCLFDAKPVKISIDTVPSEPVTWGHRFHAPARIEPKDFADYSAKLHAAKVEIDREARKARIIEDARKLCAAKKLDLVEDIGLLEELAGLSEWPVVLLGDMDPAFLDLPGEVIRLSMRTHQKYFAVRDPQKNGEGSKALAPHFITVANIDAKDGGRAIAAGNARVLSARLNDARFFWKVDTATPLFTEERKAKLQKIVFHQKLGSVWDKVERVKALAVDLCAVTGADTKLVEEAALLCKMDIVTETVGEFPELQGQVGRQLYVLEKGANDSIAAAIEDHYRPLGPNDRVPTDKVAVTLALADKLDTLAGFWAIDEMPTGSSDPYALRRAELGIYKILTENKLSLSRAPATKRAYEAYRRFFSRLGSQFVFNDTVEGREIVRAVKEHWNAGDDEPYQKVRIYNPDMVGSFSTGETFVVEAKGLVGTANTSSAVVSILASFSRDRLKVQLRDQGKRHDLVDAVFALGDDDLVRIVARVEALDAFLQTQDGANLLAGYKRAANILAAEEKKGKGLTEADLKLGVDAALLKEPAEQALHDALAKALPAARAAVEKEDFAAAMKALAALRAPVDAFFEKVLVNAPEEQLRRNRLLLLSRFTEALSAVADFSKIEG